MLKQRRGQTIKKENDNAHDDKFLIKSVKMLWR